MGYIKVSGIVIKEVNTGDADRIITLFSKSHGKVQVFAKGARRTRSSLSASCQLLAYSDFVLFKGKDSYNISSCELIEAFYDLRNDVERLTFAAHITEIVNDIVQEEQPSARLLQLYLNTLHLLNKNTKNPLLIVRVFELRAMSIIGYAPNTMDGEQIKECSSLYFSFRKSSVVSETELDGDTAAYGITAGTATAIRHIVKSPLNNLFSFEASPLLLKELSQISSNYLKDKMDKSYKKLDFLETLNIKL